jgi:hypothetical protein
MRVPLILWLGMVLAASASFAQVKHSGVEGKRPVRVTPLPRTVNPSAQTAKDLRRIEAEAAKTTAGPQTPGPKRTSGAAAVFKPEKSRPVPPINASTPGGMGTNMKGVGMTKQNKNPYRGRLRQKGSH